MGDNSPKDKNKKKKQHEKDVSDINRARNEKQQRNVQNPTQNPNDPGRKAG